MGGVLESRRGQYVARQPLERKNRKMSEEDFDGEQSVEGEDEVCVYIGPSGGLSGTLCISRSVMACMYLAHYTQVIHSTCSI